MPIYTILYVCDRLPSLTLSSSQSLSPQPTQTCSQTIRAVSPQWRRWRTRPLTPSSSKTSTSLAVPSTCSHSYVAGSSSATSRFTRTLPASQFTASSWLPPLPTSSLSCCPLHHRQSSPAASHSPIQNSPSEHSSF